MSQIAPQNTPKKRPKRAQKRSKNGHSFYDHFLTKNETTFWPQKTPRKITKSQNLPKRRASKFRDLPQIVKSENPWFGLSGPNLDPRPKMAPSDHDITGNNTKWPQMTPFWPLLCILNVSKRVLLSLRGPLRGPHLTPYVMPKWMYLG